jgi:hypothetical protein
VNKFISVPRKELVGLNCGAFVAGILEGVLGAADHTCRVVAHSTPLEVCVYIHMI